MSPRLPAQPAEAFLVQAADALHRFGVPAHRLELALLDVAGALGVELRVFATPTSLMLAFGSTDDQRHVLLRVEPAGVDLGRLAELDAVMREVAERRLHVEAASRALADVLALPQRWSTPAVVAAGLVASAGAAVLFRGSATDVVLSGVLGLVVTVYGVLAARRPDLDRSYLVMSSFGSMLLARLAARELPDVHPLVVALSALIVLLPGLTFTVAVVELASRHLASGTARLGAAAVTLLQLALGVAVARALVPLTGGLTGASSLPPWALPIAVGSAPLALAVLLQARRRDFGIILLASVLAWVGAELGSRALGPDVGAGVGAFALGVVSNVWTRTVNRPGIVPMTTGMLLLVPGSFGLRSLAFLLEGDVLVGVEQAFQMLLIAGALAAGLVLASTVVPVRRAL